MTKFFLGLVLALTTMCEVSFAQSTPFQPEVDKRFKAIEADVTTLEALPSSASYTADGISAVRVARATYDVAVNGGGTGAHGLLVSLPAKALVKQVWFQIITQFSDSGSGTVALSCEDAGNLYVAADVTGITAGTTTTGVATGSAATMVDGIAAACEITATVATAAQATGKMIVFVEYVVIE